MAGGIVGGIGEAAAKAVGKDFLGTTSKAVAEQMSQAAAKESAEMAAKAAESTVKQSGNGFFSYPVKMLKWAASSIKSGFAKGGEAVVDGKVIKTTPGFFRAHPKITMVSGSVVGFGAWATFGGDSDKTISENMGKKAADVITGAKDVAKDFGKGFVGGMSEDNDVKAVTKAVGDAGKAAKETVEDAANRVGSTLSSFGDMLGDFVSTMSNVFGGVGNMLSGLMSGKTSGLGIAGLVASAFLIFGRTGILGKAGGLLLGMMMLSGMNRQAQSQDLAQDAALHQNDELGRGGGIHR